MSFLLRLPRLLYDTSSSSSSQQEEDETAKTGQRQDTNDTRGYDAQTSDARSGGVVYTRGRAGTKLKDGGGGGDLAALVAGAARAGAGGEGDEAADEELGVELDDDSDAERRIAELLQRCHPGVSTEAGVASLASNSGQDGAQASARRTQDDSTTSISSQRQHRHMQQYHAAAARNWDIETATELFSAVNAHFMTWKPSPSLSPAHPEIGRTMNSDATLDEERVQRNSDENTSASEDRIMDASTSGADKSRDTSATESDGGRQRRQHKRGGRVGHPAELLQAMASALNSASAVLGKGKNVAEDSFRKLSACHALETVTCAAEILSRASRNKALLVSYNGFGALIQLLRQLASFLEVQCWKALQRNDDHFVDALPLQGTLVNLLGALGNFLSLRADFTFRDAQTNDFPTIEPEIIRVFVETGVLSAVVKLIRCSRILDSYMRRTGRSASESGGTATAALASSVAADDIHDNVLAKRPDRFVKISALECTVLKWITCTCRVDVATQAQFKVSGGIDALLDNIDLRGERKASSESLRSLHAQLGALFALWVVCRRNSQNAAYVVSGTPASPVRTRQAATTSGTSTAPHVPTHADGNKLERKVISLFELATAVEMDTDRAVGGGVGCDASRRDPISSIFALLHYFFHHNLEAKAHDNEMEILDALLTAAPVAVANARFRVPLKRTRGFRRDSDRGVVQTRRNGGSAFDVLEMTFFAAILSAMKNVRFDVASRQVLLIECALGFFETVIETRSASRLALMHVDAWTTLLGPSCFSNPALQEVDARISLAIRRRILTLLRLAFETCSVAPSATPASPSRTTSMPRRGSYALQEIPELRLLVESAVNTTLDDSDRAFAAEQLREAIDAEPDLAMPLLTSMNALETITKRVKVFITGNEEVAESAVGSDVRPRRRNMELNMKSVADMHPDEALFDVLICILDNSPAMRLQAVVQWTPVSVVFAMLRTSLSRNLNQSMRAREVTKKLLTMPVKDSFTEDMRRMMFDDFFGGVSALPSSSNRDDDDGDDDDDDDDDDNGNTAGGGRRASAGHGIDMKIIFLDIVSAVAEDCRPFQKVLADLGCFEKIVSTLYGDYGEDGNKRIVRHVLHAISCVICDNKEVHASFRISVGYDTLQQLLSQKLRLQDDESLAILFEFVVDKHSCARKRTRDKDSTVVVDGGAALAESLEDYSNNDENDTDVHEGITSPSSPSSSIARLPVRNADALRLLLVNAQDATREQSESVVQKVLVLARTSLANRAAMNEIDTVGLLLNWLKRLPDDADHAELVEDIIDLLRVCASFSISGDNLRLWLSLLQMKDETRCPVHYGPLLRTLREVTKMDESRAYFHFSDSRKSGIVRRAPLVWPSQRGLTFVTWMRMEAISLSQRAVLCLNSAEGQSIVLSVNEDGFRVHIRGVRNSAVCLLPARLSEGDWYHIGLSLQLSRTLSGGVAKLIVNGKCESSATVTVSKVASQFAEAYVGCCSARGSSSSMSKHASGLDTHGSIGGEVERRKTIETLAPFFGQMATIYCFDDVISEQTLAVIKSFGRQYASLFMTSDVGVFPPDVTAAGFPDAIRDLPQKAILAFAAAAVCERGCYNIADRNRRAVSSLPLDAGGIIDGDVATLLPDTRSCIMASVADTIFSHGGVGILLPLLPESFRMRDILRSASTIYGGERENEISLQSLNPSADIVHMIFQILRTSLENQAAIRKISGCDMLAFLFRFAPSESLDMSILKVLVRLIENESKVAVDDTIRADVASRLLMDVELWSSATEDARRALVSFIRKLSTHPRTVERYAAHFRPIRILSIAYTCFAEVNTPNEKQDEDVVDTRGSAATRSLPQKSFEELRRILLDSVKQAFPKPSVDTVHDVLAVLLNVGSDDGCEELLHFLLSQASTVDEWRCALADANAVPILLELLGRQRTAIRALSLRLAGIVLCSTFAAMDASFTQTLQRNRMSIISYIMSQPQQRDSFYTCMCLAIEEKLASEALEDEVAAELVLGMTGWAVVCDISSTTKKTNHTIGAPLRLEDIIRLSHGTSNVDSDLPAGVFRLFIKEPICLSTLLALTARPHVSSDVTLGVLTCVCTAVNMSSSTTSSANGTSRNGDSSIKELLKASGWHSRICSCVLLSDHEHGDDDNGAQRSGTATVKANIREKGVSLLSDACVYAIMSNTDGWKLLRDVLDDFLNHKNSADDCAEDDARKRRYQALVLHRVIASILENVRPASISDSEASLTVPSSTSADSKLLDAGPLLTNVAKVIELVGDSFNRDVGGGDDAITGNQNGSSLTDDDTRLLTSCWHLIAHVACVCDVHLTKVLNGSSSGGNASSSLSGGFSSAALLYSSQTTRQKCAVDTRIRDAVWRFVATSTRCFLGSASVEDIAAALPQMKGVAHYIFNDQHIKALSDFGIDHAKYAERFCVLLSSLLDLKMALRNGIEPARELFLSQLLQDFLSRGEPLLMNGIASANGAKGSGERAVSLHDLLRTYSEVDDDADRDAQDDVAYLNVGMKKLLERLQGKDQEQQQQQQGEGRERTTSAAVAPAAMSATQQEQERSPAASSSSGESSVSASPWKWNIFPLVTTDDDRFRAFKAETETKLFMLQTLYKDFRASYAFEREKFVTVTEKKWRSFLRGMTSDRGLWANSLAATALHSKERWCWKLDKAKDPSCRRWRLRRKYYVPSEDEPIRVGSVSQSESDHAAAGSPSSYAALPARHGGGYEIDDDTKDDVLDADAIETPVRAASLIMAGVGGGGGSGVGDLLQPSLAQDNADSGRSTGGDASAADDKKTISQQACSLVTPIRTVAGELRIVSDVLEFHEDITRIQSEEEQMDSREAVLKHCRQKIKRIPVRNIRRVLLRRFLLRWSALELWLSDRRTVFLNFESKRVAKDVAKKLLTKSTAVCASLAGAAPRADEVLKTLGGASASEFFSGVLAPESSVTETSPLAFFYRRREVEIAEKLRDAWKRREMTNFDYLMNLNVLAGRTFNDLTQYPVFPWVIQDFSSEVLDLENPATFRDLSLPIGAINPDRRAFFIERYQSFNDPEIPSFHYGTHYSSSATVIYFLLRLEPFTSLHRALQGGKFDHAERLFSSVAITWRNCLEGSSDVKELIPEFYYQPDFLRNVNGNDFGSKQSGSVVGDVELPPWAKGSAEEFVRLNREALESDYVSARLHNWVDLIFGFKQRGEAAVEATNVFYYLTYEGAVDLDKVRDENQKASIKAQINYYGQTPMQLFRRPHPAREARQQQIARPLRRPRDVTSIESVVRLPAAADLVGSRAEYRDADASKAAASIVFIAAVDSLVVAVHGNRHVSAHKLVRSIPAGFTSSSSVLSISVGGASMPCNLESDKAPSRRLPVPFAESIRTDAMSSSRFAVLSHGRFVVSCGHWDNGLRVSAIDDGREVQMLLRHRAVVTCVAVSEGRLLVTGGEDTSVMIWAVNPSWLPSSSSSSSSSSSASSSKTGPIFEEPLRVLHGHVSAISCVAASLRLDVVASGAHGSPVYLHSLRSGDFIGQLSADDSESGAGAGMSTPRMVRISSNFGVVVIYWSSFVISAHSVNGRHFATLEVSERIVEMTIVEDGGYLVTAGAKGTLCIRSLYTLDAQSAALSVGSPVSSLALTAEDHILLGMDNGDVVLARFASGEDDVEDGTISTTSAGGTRRSPSLTP